MSPAYPAAPAAGEAPAPQAGWGLDVQHGRVLRISGPFPPDAVIVESFEGYEALGAGGFAFTVTVALPDAHPGGAAWRGAPAFSNCASRPRSGGPFTDTSPTLRG